MEHVKDIIVAILGVITLADLLKFFFIKQDRKEKDVKNKDIEIETLRHTNELLTQQLDRQAATIEKKDAEIAKLTDEKARLMATQSCLFDDMCIHKGCRIRKPHQGKGALWYENYRNDPALGADYDSIDTLLKRDRAKRLAEESGKPAEKVQEEES